MVISIKKGTKTNNNTSIQSLPDPKLDNKLSKKTPKSRRQIDHENYLKRKEYKKAQRKLKYQQQKQLQQEKQRQYYQAHQIKVLLSLKQYINLNLNTKLLWKEFTSTLSELNQGIADIVEVQELYKLAGNLITNYYQQTDKQVERLNTRWNLLSEEEQEQALTYWSNLKALQKNKLLTQQELIEQQSKSYREAIELSKFHEERGKENCPCYQCSQIKQKEKQLFKGLKSGKEKVITAESECSNCGEHKKVNSETGLCKPCSKE